MPMSPENKRIKKEGIWYYALDGDTEWTASRGMKGVVTYAKTTMDRGYNTSSVNCRIGTSLAHTFLGVPSTCLELEAGQVKYFRSGLRVTHTIMPAALAVKINRKTMGAPQEDGAIDGETIVYRV